MWQVKCTGLEFLVSQATLASVSPVFTVTNYDKQGNVTLFERKKSDLYQELGLRARDLRLQDIIDYHHQKQEVYYENGVFESCDNFSMSPDIRLLSFQLRAMAVLGIPFTVVREGQLVTYPLSFEFRAMEAPLQYWINAL
ncbi:hypothetical protein P7K49_026736 [Saguinus oedipus]|uniref:Uncharacterized protein n=1 Tax=Saguinus oedipus TaxID=9490 RepID=A0ABQ9UEX1_SAGOE|nr:hypothetical protein P7K49_026736 [Saguinus oedipus]